MKQTVLDILALSHTKEMTPQPSSTTRPPLFTPMEGTKLPLPKPQQLTPPSMALHEAITQRRSHRKFSQEPLSLEALSYALWMTQGVKKVVDDRATFRMVPSAGARHAFETYLLINQVDTLSPGLYVYDAQTHALVLLEEGKAKAHSLMMACHQQRMVTDAAVCFFWVAQVERMSARYAQRSARYLLLDAGHIAQNLYLVATAQDLGTCAIGAFEDVELNEALGLNLSEQTVLYAAPYGPLERTE